MAAKGNDRLKGLLEKTRLMLEMIRFSHTIFALPFALLAAVMAWQTPNREGVMLDFRTQDLIGILLCMITARSAAMAFNRLVDRDIDRGNPRTAQRHLPAGSLSVRSVVFFTVACCGGFLLSTLLFLPNRLPVILAIPVLLIILAYSLTKRFTSLAHFWLGFSLMLAPVATWIALRGHWVIAAPSDLTPALVLGLAVLFWVSGFDIIYSCMDFEFDRKAKLRSVPTALGVAGALRVAAICHAVMLLLLVTLPWFSTWAGLQTGLGWVYYVGVVAVAVLLIYEHCLVKPDDLTRVNMAFFNVNAVVSFGIFVVGSLDSFL